MKIKLRTIISLIIIIAIQSFWSITAFATEDYYASWDSRKSLPIESDSYEGWPKGPKIGAKGAILLEARTGTILYAKNIHEKHYPASTTKILTTLLGIENCKLDEDVKISREAVFSIERDSSNVGLDPGEVITVEQCLYAILVGSANEASNALGEHVSGSIPEFVELMNKRAGELGCENSHFVTTNGLHDSEHYTTPYDLAQIARAFFDNEMLCKISSTPRYHIPKSDTQPDEDLYINTHNQLIMPGSKNQYEYVVGSKTGFTTNSRQTLVSCAEKDGLKLICVVMQEESPHQFDETIKLFDWGFERFKNISVSENEIAYNVNEQDFFQEENDVFGVSGRLINIDKEDYVTVPITAVFTDLESSMEYKSGKNEVAVINYSYHGRPVGSARVTITPLDNSNSFDFASGSADKSGIGEGASSNTIYINIKSLLVRTFLVTVILTLILIIHSTLSDYNFSNERSGGYLKRDSKPRQRRRFKRQKSPFEDL